MVSFKYGLNQDFVELQASNWNGLERVFINGEMVSRKMNFGRRSEHRLELNDGHSCRFKLLIEPETNQLICRIYKQDQLITSLKQGKLNLLNSQRAFYRLVLATAGLIVGLSFLII